MKDPDVENNKESNIKGFGPTQSFDGLTPGPGSKIGLFRIEHELGRGGAGVVYLAHDTKLNRSVAIKSLPPEVKDNPKALSRFTREARVLASLNHPNIATIHEVLEGAEGLSYLVLEYIPGQTLAERIAKRPLKLEEALKIALQIAEAVAAAHEHDVIHRDLKPGNIKITEEGKVKVLDFGLAKVVGVESTDQKTTITEPGRVIGTPAYMSPEQARGKLTDKRSDIWSFGCVLYEMLTTTVPFKGETISDTLANILQTEPRWEMLPENIPTSIRFLLRHCLEKEPRRRLHDIGDAAITIEDTTTELRRSTLPIKSLKADRAQPVHWSRRALPWFITGMAMAVLIFFAFIIGLKLGGSPEKQSRKSISGTAVKSIKAIVVLPFENLSGDPEQEYFVDGMRDELSAELGKISALTVKGQHSAVRYKDTDKQMSDIARELGVDAVITGSVFKAANKVRITTQLIHGPTDENLWADSYEDDLADVITLQREVALAIAKEIKVKLTPQEEEHLATARSINPKAYEAFVKGKFFYFKFTEAGFNSAVNYLQQAIDIDPNYAEAHAWASLAHWLPSIWGYSRPEKSFTRARSAADKAVALDKTLAMAHVSVGWIALAYDWQWQKAKESFEQARRLNPNDPEAYSGLGWYLVVAGRLDEAIEMMQITVELDPLSPIYSTNLAFMYSLSGQIEKAIEQREKALELAPGFVVALDNLAEDYLSMSMYPKAVTTLERAMTLAGRTPAMVTSLADVYALSGRKDKAETLLQELQERATSEYILPTYFAEVYASLGNTEEAFRWLEKAYKERSWGMLFLRIWPMWDPLRSDPKFDEIVRSMNFPEAPDSETKPKSEETTQAPIEKIAVLPFTSISSEAGDEWFVDGMTEALITQLGKIKALTVISRTSAMQYKNVSKPMREIAQDLGVDGLIEGSVTRAGNNIQITARLIDGRTDERVWGDFFQDTFSNILALQSKVALAIAQEIEVALTPEEETRITHTEEINPKAYVAFLKGRFYFFKSTKEGFELAQKYLEDAIEIDPNYAEAYARLAPAYWLPSTYGYEKPQESFRKAKKAVDNAKRLNNSLSMAHYADGMIALAYDWDWHKAKESFEQARELNPNDPLLYQSLAYYFVVTGRLDEAVDAIQTALKLDPLSLMFNNTLGSIYELSRQFEQAVKQYKNTLELDQNYLPSIIGLAGSYQAISQYSEAITEIKRAMSLAGRTPVLLTLLAETYALSGSKGEAETLLKELQERAASEYVLPIYLAEVYASLGNTNEALRWLKTAHEEHNWGMFFLRHAWYWDPLRSDPKFDEIVRQMKFPE